MSQIGAFVSYATALPGYLAKPMSREQAARRLARSLTSREHNFLRVLDRGVYRNPASPYLALLRWAGVEHGDVAKLVGNEGVEGALGKLYDAGVHVALDEIKGRRGIERPGLALPASRSAFDNPLLVHHYDAESSGSRGQRTRVMVDLGMLEHEAAYVSHYLDAFGIRDRPYAVWRPVPPSAAAVKWMMRLEKLGKPLEKWFSQTKHAYSDGHARFALFTNATFALGRSLGRRFPLPQHVPADSPRPVTAWLADCVSKGQPAVLDTIVSSAVRVCLDAQQRGRDIAGTFFRVGGEPLSDAKRTVIESTGCRVVCFYSMTEMSFVGAPCADADAPDDVHLLTDKVAALVRARTIPGGTVDGLIYTTLLPSSPKLMLNVESGDFARLTTRTCKCPMGQLGFHSHLSGIRSYDKLTSEGVTFLGTELLRLIEEVLPAEFGGAPTDYQFVEIEEQRFSRIHVMISPQVGALDEQAVIARILGTLRSYPGGLAMTEVWERGDTLRVVRDTPRMTASAKVLPLHLQQSASR